MPFLERESQPEMEREREVIWVMAVTLKILLSMKTAEKMETAQIFLCSIPQKFGATPVGPTAAILLPTVTYSPSPTVSQQHCKGSSPSLSLSPPISLLSFFHFSESLMAARIKVPCGKIRGLC